MQLVASFRTNSLSGHDRHLDLCIGDVTEGDKPADLLCISAFPNDYTPTPQGVIGALAAKGVSIEMLARDKAYDWRELWNCWASKPLPGTPLAAKRFLCFEHGWGATSHLITTESAPELVGNVFRAVHELVMAEASPVVRSGDTTLDCIRLPLLASGDQRADRGAMLDATIRQGYLRLVSGLPVKRVEIVLHPSAPDLHQLLVRAGQAFEHVRSEWTQQHGSDARDYDFFISYRHADLDHLTPVVDAMRTLEPGIRLFIDRERLEVGCYWKTALIGGLASSERALCFVTDSYSDSRECMDEFHASLCIARERADGFLRPVLRLRSRSIEQLPVSLRRVHCIDASKPEIAPEVVATRVLKGL